MVVVSTSNLFLMAILAVAGIAKADQVVKVTPITSYPIEYSSHTITCAAHDVINGVVPGRIQISKLTQVFGSEIIMDDGDSNLNFTTTREHNGSKLIVAMKIINVTQYYDSGVWFHICRAYSATGGSQMGEDRFAIKIIKESEVPIVTVSKLKEVDHSVNMTIFCNVSFRGSHTTILKGFWWTKDGQNLTDSFKDAASGSTSLVLKDIGIKDGGKYSCIVFALLEQRHPHQVEASTSLTIKPWFERKDNESVRMNLGADLTLECGARGYPLNVEWKFKSDTDGSVKPCINSSKDGRYEVSQKGPYEPYSLTIESLSKADLGVYYCCLPSGCSEDINTDQCQSFDIDEKGCSEDINKDQCQSFDDTDEKGDPTAETVSVVAQNVFVILALFVVSLCCL